jgi:hypothetical protein
MGKESSSDSKTTHSAYFRKQYFEFEEGEFLRFKEDSFYHTWEAISRVWGRLNEILLSRLKFVASIMRNFLLHTNKMLPKYSNFSYL